MHDPSFEEYARAKGSSLVRFAYLLTADWALAEDLAQEALVSAHAKWRRIERMEHPDAYVRRAVVRKFLSWRRKRCSSERPGGSGHELQTSSAPDHATELADRDAVWRLLQQLPRQQRAVLVLRYYEDLADDRIAQLLGCSPSTVRVHASRAVASLRQQLPDHFPSTNAGRTR